MGQEANCKGRYQGRTAAGKAMLETDYVLFRGDFRVKIAFRDMTSVNAARGWLEIRTAAGALGLELGPAAAKWADKILHPPSRLDKLGVKQGMRVSFAGFGDDELARQIQALDADLQPKLSAASDMIFVGAEDPKPLHRLESIARSLKDGGAIWVVYPKGVRHITENDVLAAIRAAGLVDTKVASFSSTHTALKAMIPVAKRNQRAAR